MFITSFEFPVATGLGIGGLVVLSWIGYGYLAALLSGDASSLPWGLLAGLGLALLITLGGVQAALSIVSMKMNIVVIVVGLVSSIIWLKSISWKRSTLADTFQIPDDLAERRAFILVWTLRAMSLGIIILHLVGSIFPFWMDECDDPVAYFYLPKKLLQTGTLLEPFSQRRLASLGGMQYLQTFLYPVFGASSLPFTDMGLGKLFLWAAAHGFLADPKKPSQTDRLKRELVALLALLLSMAFIMFNHAAVVMPTAMLLCLYALLLRDNNPAAGASWRRALLLGLIAAGLIAMRNNFIILVAPLLMIHVVFKNGDSPRIMEKTKFLGLMASTIIICLASWLLLSYRSSGTIFYPAFKGFYTFPFGMGKPLLFTEKLSFVVNNFTASKAVIIPTLAFLALMSRRDVKLTWALAVSITIAVAGLSAALTGFDTFNIYRYNQPILFSGIIALIALLVAGNNMPSFFSRQLSRLWLYVAALVAVFWWLFWPATLTFNAEVARSTEVRNGEYITSNTEEYYIAFKRAINANTSEFEALSPDRDAVYRYVQESLPRGARIISATAQPFHWDFARQAVDTLDVIGQVSPPPGMPFFHGPESMTGYFRRLGYRYLAYTPFDSPNCLYSRVRWEARANGETFLWKQWAPYFLDFFKNVDALERRGAVVLRSPNMNVIDLQAT